MKRALISVFDKTGVLDFARALVELGYEIVSTGGTEKAFRDASIPVIGITEVTGFPECLDGRLKTLHPRIHGGILGIRENKDHMKQLNELDISLIDIVAVNLYPFKQTISKEGVAFEEAVENIDIGGPTMLRAAAKNWQDVAAVIDPKDYNSVIDELSSNGDLSKRTRKKLMEKVFRHTADYDSAIANYLAKAQAEEDGEDAQVFPDTLLLTYEKAQEMRYGENPHQKAAFYREYGSNNTTLPGIEQLHGKELSFNNINDTHGAVELLREFSEATVVACKHSNPCGVGSGKDIYTAFMRAYTSDPVSIFGGIIAANRAIDEKTANEINKLFIEIVIAPGFSDEALAILRKKKNIRLLKLEGISAQRSGRAFDVKKVSGGLLIQETDSVLLPSGELSCVTERKPTDEEMENLLFAWKLVKHVKSNGIAIGKNNQSVGIGVGQVNRIWAANQAIDHAVEALGKESLIGAAMASDAFFPMDDCVEAAAAAGITAIIQPGGSINDQKSIDACDKHGIAMVFTVMRHFRH